MMASWQDVRSYVGGKYVVNIDGGDHMSLLFRFGDGRSQRLFLKHDTTSDGREWVRIESPVAESVARTDVPRLLSQVRDWVIGGLGQVGDFVTYRHSIALHEMTVDEFDIAFDLVMAFADVLEQSVSTVDRF